MLNFEQFIFYIFAATLLFSGLMVVVLRNAVHSALFLVLSFFASAGLWLMLESEFLALILVLVYVGAVMTLFLFVIMTLNLEAGAGREGFVKYLPYGAVIMAIIVTIMVYVIGPKHFALVSTAHPLRHGPNFSNVAELGAVLYTQHAFSFEIAGALLLIAIVAAISLTFRGNRAGKVQNPAEQISARPEGRLRLVK